MENLPRIKIFRRHDGLTLDDDVNQWIEQTGCRVVQIIPAFAPDGAVVGMVVRYLAQVAQVVDQPINEQSDDFTGTVVSREVDRLEDGKMVGRDYCMAGAFPVPEYHVLLSEDTEIAPMVLLSPDCKLAPYSDWFRFPDNYEAIATARAVEETNHA